MKVLVVLSAAVACALGAPKVSLQAISTPLSRGGVGGSLMCGGSLVAEDRVITAGHCCDGQSASRLGVRVGSQNLYDEDEDQADIAVSKVILHESYDDWTISLPSSGEEYSDGTMCTVTGWGTTSEGGSLG